MTERMELPNQEKIRILRKRKLTSTWGYWKRTTLNGDERTKIKKEYLRRTRKQLETKLYCRKFIKEIISWVVFLVRYS